MKPDSSLARAGGRLPASQAPILEDTGERLHRDFLDGLPVTAYTTDANGTITQFNKAAARLWGRTPAPGEKWCGSLRLFTSEGHPLRHEDCPMATSIRENRPIHGVEAAAERPDGTRFHFLAFATPFRDDDGELVGAMNAMVDITERKRAETALVESERRFRDLFENAHDLIQSVRPDGTLIYVNRAWRETLGYGEDEIESLSIPDIISPDCLNHCFSMFQRVMEGEDIGSIETIFKAKDGSLVHVEGTSNCRFVDGQPVSTRSIFRDITGRKATERRLDRLNHTYAVLSGINQLIVRERERRNLFAETCRIAVELGGLRMAWICVLDEETGRRWITAHAGANAAAVTLLETFLNSEDPSQGCSFTTRALESGTHAVCNDLANAPDAESWRALKPDPECRSMAALPLKSSGQVIGTLNLYASETDFFDGDETLLLDELADDIGFALDVGRREAELRDATARHARQRKALLTLTENRQVDGGDIRSALRMITEAAVETLEVARCSIWRYVRDRSAIECVDLFEEQAARHSAGDVVSTSDHPAYFSALAELEMIAAEDAVADSRTHELARDYLEPLGVGAMLDVPITVSGARAGVLCIEHIGGTRAWAEDEKSFALALANLVSLTLEGGVRRQAEDALRASETRFRQLTETIEEVFWIVDPAHHAVLYVSPAYEKIWQRSCESLYADPGSWLDAVHEEDQARIAEARKTKQADGDYDETYRILQPDGEVRWIRDRAFPVRGPGGEILRIVGTAEDITERKAVETQLLRTQRMESIGTLAGGIAHDLNNVLAPIMMSIELLKMGETDPMRLEVLATIENSARHGAGMVRQVLTFAKGVEGQKMDVQPAHLLKEIKKIADETFLKGIQIQSHIPSDLWVVCGDPTQIHQVLLNLCVNARDAMPEGGTLTLSATNLVVDAHFAAMSPEATAGPHVLIQIEDTGTGMSRSVLERIFEPFYTTKEPGHGTGLGLSTTLAIIKGHGGFVRVHSEPAVGTRFQIFLPAPNTSASSGTMQAARPEFLRGHGELILVVDDEEGVLQITRQTLETFGYRVLVATDGAEATALYMNHKDEIALVLTDMMMPIMDGPTTIQVLMRVNPNVRIIAASGLDADDMVAKAASSGVEHFLSKPFTAETLLMVVHEILSE